MSAKPIITSRSLEQFLDTGITLAREVLLAHQHENGHWCFEFEADCTIPSEYILMMHYMDEIDVELEAKLARYIRAHQNEGGGWSLYFGGESDISCTVKAYYALKLAGDEPGMLHMSRAREVILALGGVERSNVFTRITLALFGQVPWGAVPFIPAEIMLLPRWFFFHIYKVASWSRTVMVPLFILCTLKPHARNPRKIDVRELFQGDPAVLSSYFDRTVKRSPLARVFLLLERCGRIIEPMIPQRVRGYAIAKAEQWFIARLNGENGLNGIFPAMVNAYEALEVLGYSRDHPYRRQALAALRGFVIEREEDAYCQPCVSPVWDTCLAVHALEEAGEPACKPVLSAIEWLKKCQIVAAPGDWQVNHKGVCAGGWAFQYSNDYYPDLDDTAAVAWAIAREGREEDRSVLNRAADWLVAMQSRNGGFAAYDADNTRHYLNEIPFADHKALLDPPTADVTGRVVSFLACLNRSQDCGVLRDAVRFLLAEQEESGAWFGRWGTNYIYGTWSVLMAFELLKEPSLQPAILKAAAWLKSTQQVDGGWGESNDSYAHPDLAGRGQPSVATQTAWATLGLMAAGEAQSRAVQRGIRWLLEHQTEGSWHDAYFNAPGFPRVFYLIYHGYRYYFPLWALARYRRAMKREEQ
ncbi:MAG TPA: squalene--hopene cyclase [Burkholderiales bacterium]|nr:squalene--hopene cyclase [Burkholderiales bacterium]